MKVPDLMEHVSVNVLSLPRDIRVCGLISSYDSNMLNEEKHIRVKIISPLFVMKANGLNVTSPTDVILKLALTKSKIWIF